MSMSRLFPDTLGPSVWARRMTFFDPNTDPNGPPNPSGEETYTKQQVEQIIQGRISKLQQEKAQLQSTVDSLQKTLTDLEKRLKSLENPPPPPPHDDDIKGQLKLMEQNHQREISSVRDELNSERKKREQAEKAQRELERTNEVDAGLVAAGCRQDALEIGRSYFLHKIERLEDEEKWIFRLKGGGTCSIADGIKAELPDFLKEPSHAGGGSGFRSNGSGKAAKQSRLQEEKDKLSQLQQAARSGRDPDILAYQQQKRVVNSLERELAATH